MKSPGTPPTMLSACMGHREPLALPDDCQLSGRGHHHTETSGIFFSSFLGVWGGVSLGGGWKGVFFNTISDLYIVVLVPRL